MDISRETAHAMASWWGNKVCTNTHHDNGDRGMSGLFASVLADSLNKEVTNEQRQRFIDILEKKIMDADRISSWDLDCDYAPSKFLSDAAKEAGIDSHNFPWKTCMRIDDNGRVFVRDGYRAPSKQIWPKEEASVYA